MTTAPRVAYFPDSFHEVNGVAHTSRHFEAFARRRNLPILTVRAGAASWDSVFEGVYAGYERLFPAANRPESQTGRGCAGTLA